MESSRNGLQAAWFIQLINLEVKEQENRLIEVAIFPEILTDKHSLGHLESWMYYTLKEVTEKHGSFPLKYAAEGTQFFNLATSHRQTSTRTCPCL